jgi:hypothetical protein
VRTHGGAVQASTRGARGRERNKEGEKGGGEEDAQAFFGFAPAQRQHITSPCSWRRVLVASTGYVTHSATEAAAARAHKHSHTGEALPLPSDLRQLAQVHTHAHVHAHT